MYYIYIHAQIVKIILSATYKQVNFSLAVSGDDATRAFENEKRYWNYTLRKCNEPWKKCGHYKLVNFFLEWYTHEWLFIHPGGGWNSFASMSLTTRILFFFLSFVVSCFVKFWTYHLLLTRLWNRQWFVASVWKRGHQQWNWCVLSPLFI